MYFNINIYEGFAFWEGIYILISTSIYMYIKSKFVHWFQYWELFDQIYTLTSLSEFEFRNRPFVLIVLHFHFVFFSLFDINKLVIFLIRSAYCLSTRVQTNHARFKFHFINLKKWSLQMVLPFFFCNCPTTTQPNATQQPNRAVYIYKTPPMHLTQLSLR